MHKLTMVRSETITFSEGCDKYIQYCRQRNLRQATINHYEQSYKQFFKFFDSNMPLCQMTEHTYNDYVVYLCDSLTNDISINSYLRDLITTIHFLQNEGYVQQFKMKAIKTNKEPIETYTEEELKCLLQKPNLKQCKFIDYQAWVMTNFLFSTGVRQKSLMYIKIKDIDFDNNVVYVNMTKNRKPLIVPLTQTMTNILKEFLKYRQNKNNDDYLFCNVFGQQLVKSTCYHQLYDYNKRRGIQTTGIHRYRHTFAKQWILNGGNVVTLQKILGHSSLAITQNYINLLVSDAVKEVNEINLLDKFGNSSTHKIKMNNKKGKTK